VGWQPFVLAPEVLEPARRIVRFFETADVSLLDGVFTDDAVLLESVSPYVFSGAAGVAEWAEQLLIHVGGHDGLRGSLGEPQELSTDEHTTAFCSLPVTWNFSLIDAEVEELGAMVLLLRKDRDAWRIARYAWAVVEVRRTLR